MRKWIITGGLLLVLLAAACGSGQKEEYITRTKESPVFYLANADRTNLVPVVVELEEEGVEEVIRESLSVLQNGKLEKGGYPTVPKELTLVKVELKGDTLVLDWPAWYATMSPIDELLCRSSVVRSVTALDFVRDVEFYVKGIPLTNQDGIAYGKMTQSDVIIDLHAEMKETVSKEVTFYYAAKDGQHLVPLQKTIVLDTSKTLEANVLGAYIQADEAAKTDKGEPLTKPVSSKTQLKNVYVNEGICYVDLAEDFLSRPLEKSMTEKTVIYGIVNTLTDLKGITRVQFLVEGEIIASYKGTLPFDNLFSRDEDILAH
ncbi:GerMN domain-containing protein [Anaerotalea alkaliphila]|uniref:GerMN domain-containing protein n=1 Tax=Anaerotalea alkaliphila TaxID=2662126 RepID=A0A7X5HUG8_9FIRM|nr:GerMN domain-containing protein [Anaerotalea alkaliphila]NDL66905.1 hypothetical protein [Anaerotalea alkaliphila]